MLHNGSCWTSKRTSVTQEGLHGRSWGAAESYKVLADVTRRHHVKQQRSDASPLGYAPVTDPHKIFQ